MLVSAAALAAPGLAAINYPSPPQEPTVSAPQAEPAVKPGGTRRTRKTESVPLLNVRLKIHLGDKSMLMAQTAIPATYSFTHKKGQLQYQQTIRAEDIRELAIENYRARRVSQAKDGEVFEFEPSSVRIELKDGQVFKLPYLFKDIRRLKGQNADGAFSVFAFFADTYNARTGWHERPGAAGAPGKNGETLYSRQPHPAAFIRLEYFEAVEKTGAGSDAAEDKGLGKK